MIDERAVVTAKFWEVLRSLRAPSGLREDEFEQFALVVIGLVCVAKLPYEGSHRVQGAFGMLMQVNMYRDEERLRQAWFTACDELGSSFRRAGQFEIPSEPWSSTVFIDIVQLLDRYPTREYLLDCFDEVFHRVIGRLTGVGYRSGDAAATLAAHLSMHVSSVSEYFATTGEFAVLRRTRLDVATSARIAVIDRLNFFIGFRLHLYGIDVDDRAPSEGELASFVDRRFLLIDHPQRNTTGQLPLSPEWADQQTSLVALDQLLNNRASIEVGLIVVPGADRSATGWRNTLREHLVRSGKLLAVIDLPQERANRSRKQVSAWFLGEGRLDDYVLMVDAKSLYGRGEFREVGVLMEFVAAIVSLGALNTWPSIRLSRHQQSVMGDVESMLESYFKDGYRDVGGICRRVRLEELAENTFKLSASIYLGGVGTEKKHGTFMSLLNSEPVLEALRQGYAHGTRIYVIGNNGEGKSVLLANLAKHLVQEGRRVVGISFGLTDRFPFERPKNDGQLFSYVGARTSESGISLSRTSADVNRMVREVHVDPVRLEVFNAVVSHLGFGERRYLVPIDLNSSFDEGRARYAELQQLTDNADENARILLGTTPNKYVLGLMRQESQSSITTFGELSSGEQQLLTLALKLTAYASDRSVILIDEPELSLHVSWQRAIPAILEIVGSRFSCSIVVATHSPVIVASATHHSDRCFVARRHALTELSQHQRRSVETALFDGFQTYTLHNRQVHERCATIVSQTIQRLNSLPLLQDDDFPTVESLQEELKLMERIIRLADSAQLSHAQEDLELIAHTRAALDELSAIGRGYMA